MWPTRTPSTSVMAFHGPDREAADREARDRAGGALVIRRRRGGDDRAEARQLRLARVDGGPVAWTGLGAVTARLRRARRLARLAPLLAQALEAALEDVADERAVLDARRRRDEAEVGVAGREPGQRVHLDDVELALRREAQVDARDVAAVERREGLAAHALDGLELGGRQVRGALVADVLLPLLLDLEVVDGPLVAPCP